MFVLDARRYRAPGERLRGAWCGIALVAASWALLPAPAGAQPTRCEVLDHARDWVERGIYYSQGPYGGYCRGSMYCDPLAGGACYRPDCSGYVSAVWGLPAPGNTTYSLAGGPWDDGRSHRIAFDDLLPGDALNFPGNPSTGTGHIRLFGGWLNAARTRLWGYETSTCGTTAYRFERDRSEFGAYVAIRRNDIRPCGPPPPATPTQVMGNGAITVANWAAAEHVEVWVRGEDGRLHHSWSTADDAWAPLNATSAAASCGFAAAHWPTTPDYVEVFLPTSAGGTAHMWWDDGARAWRGPEDFGGAGLTELSTLLWPDGRNEVFALGPDGQIHHRFWRAAEREWSAWAAFGSGVTFRTGATAIVWGDGRPEVFATGADGRVRARWWRTDSSSWSDWTVTLGDARMASRPIPVRWDSGRLEVFARGEDGYLYHAWHFEGAWHPLERLGDAPIQGEPSAIFNPRGNGGPFGPQVFARDTDGRLFEIHMTDGAWGNFLPLLADRELAAEPFGWVRRDGIALLFAIDAAGNLVHSHREPASGWQPWTVIGGARVDACIPEPEPEPEPGVDAGTVGPGVDAGADAGAVDGADAGDPDPVTADGGGIHPGPDAGASPGEPPPAGPLTGGGCSAGPGPVGHGGWLALGLLGLAFRLRGRRKRV